MPPLIDAFKDMWAFAWRGLVLTYAVAAACYLLARFDLWVFGW